MEVSVKSANLLGPFWLMVAAWLCANVPHSAYVEVIQGLEGIRHFSHQAQLTADTLNVLQGRGHQAVVKSESAPRKAPPGRPAGIPGESLLKKFEFAVLACDDIREPIEARVNYSEFESRPPDVFFGDVPHPPPRNGVIG